ncbi:MAG: Pyruvate formate-lyase 1-activating enzyme [Syntrophaceae bacterium PtaU1.Bin231]|jgi:pyruvate formate lyase activating enzyme|nr:MAG: Pyruvate formate-lyase 1-activating enzyme [Syntrophaceae bacterium PtaU1.Bin231]
MRIGGWQKVSLIDYPGEICAVVFLQGCNFRCPYCHNPDLVDPARFGECLPVEDVFAYLDSRRGKLDAVTVSGGEPTLQPDLPDFIRRIRTLGFKVKLDTNGSRPEMLENLIRWGLVDYLAMDIKGPLHRYREITGADIDAGVIAKSIAVVMNSGIAYEFRTTAVKSLLKPEEAAAIGKSLENADRYVLNRFISAQMLDQTFFREESYTERDFQAVAPVLGRYVSQVLFR